jgi:hypothetical protein
MIPDVILGVAVLALVIYRQLTARRSAPRPCVVITWRGKGMGGIASGW